MRNRCMSWFALSLKHIIHAETHSCMHTHGLVQMVASAWCNSESDRWPSSIPSKKLAKQGTAQDLGGRDVEGWRGRGVLNTCGQGSSFGSSTTSHGTRQSRTMLIILTARLWVSFQSLQCLLCYSQTSGFQSLHDFSGGCIKDFPTHPINSRRGTTVTGDMGFQGTQLV